MSWLWWLVVGRRPPPAGSSGGLLSSTPGTPGTKLPEKLGTHPHAVGFPAWGKPPILTDLPLACLLAAWTAVVVNQLQPISCDT
jgi:hypothetical protein